MGETTKIEWTDSTWNPTRACNIATGKVGWHCEHVSEGCRNCYAEGMNRRLGTGIDFKPGHRKDIEIFLDEKMLLAPLKWNKPRTIFVNSMTDTFAQFVTDAMIDRMFAVMALAPQHRFQVLTKRAKRMREYIVYLGTSDWRARLGDTCRTSLAVNGGYPPWPLPNVWLGVSAEDQANADARIDHLMMTEATVNFVSLEPLLGPIDLSKWVKALDWVIVGGESGPHARPMHPQWARSLRDQCKAAGVAFFMKQWGEWTPHYGDRTRERLAVCQHGSAPFTIKANEQARQFDLLDRCQMIRVGKRAAGRLLDGIEHNGMPR